MARDRLSALTDDLLCSRILSKLCLKDAISSSAISRRWQRLWTLLPHLKFVNQETEVIDNIMFFHSAELEGLEISICGSINCEMMRKWVRCASLKRVKQITLEIDGILYPYMKVPTSLFSCDCLTVLELKCFDFEQLPPHFCGFNYLKTCSLSIVTITDQIAEELVAKCPLLENLTVCGCQALENLNICAANLKYLNFTSNYSATSVTGNCPQLVNIRLDGCSTELRMKIKSRGVLHLYTSELETLKGLSTTKTVRKITLDGFRTSLRTSLRVLSHFYYLEELFIESKIKLSGLNLTLTLRHLKKVHVKVSGFNEKEVALLGCLLRSALFLQTMTLSLPECPRSIHDKDFLEKLLGLKRSFREATVLITGKNDESCDGCELSSDDKDTPSSDEESSGDEDTPSLNEEFHDDFW